MAVPGQPNTTQRWQERMRIVMASTVARVVVDIVAAMTANALRDLRAIVLRRRRLPALATA